MKGTVESSVGVTKLDEKGESSVSPEATRPIGMFSDVY